MCGFLDKKILNIKMYFCNISATIISMTYHEQYYETIVL